MGTTARLGAVCAAALVATLACSAALRRPVAADVAVADQSWPGTTLADLERGREVYVRRCSGCHHLWLPGSRPPRAWPGEVDGMKEKARLSPAERDDLVRFLVTLSTAEWRKEPSPP